MRRRFAFRREARRNHHFPYAVLSRLFQQFIRAQFLGPDPFQGVYPSHQYEIAPAVTDARFNRRHIRRAFHHTDDGLIPIGTGTQGTHRFRRKRVAFRAPMHLFDGFRQGFRQVQSDRPSFPQQVVNEARSRLRTQPRQVGKKFRQVRKTRVCMSGHHQFQPSQKLFILSKV